MAARKDTPQLGSVPFSTLSTWKEKIVEDSLGWVTKVKKVTEPELLEAYQAGLEQGMGRIVKRLEAEGVLTVPEHRISIYAYKPAKAKR